MKVLAGIDGTERGDHAVAYASRILDAKADDLWFYYSPPKRLPFSRLESGLTELAQNALANAIFDKAAEQLPTPITPSQESRIVGKEKPCDGILAAAKQIDAELIVIGAHSSSRRLRLFLGGTARNVAHRTDIPLLLVREKQASSREGMRVLVLCDEKEHWYRAASALDGLSWPDGTKLTLFHVIEAMSNESVEQLVESAHASVPNAAQLIDEYRSCLTDQLAIRQRQLRDSRDESLPQLVREALCKVSQGHVVDEVLREVQNEDIDLVVVGARRLGRVERLLGSTTEALLSQCPCSLLIVPEVRES